MNVAGMSFEERYLGYRREGNTIFQPVHDDNGTQTAVYTLNEDSDKGMRAKHGTRIDWYKPDGSFSHVGQTKKIESIAAGIATWAATAVGMAGLGGLAAQAANASTGIGATGAVASPVAAGSAVGVPLAPAGAGSFSFGSALSTLKGAAGVVSSVSTLSSALGGGKSSVPSTVPVSTLAPVNGETQGKNAGPIIVPVASGKSSSAAGEGGSLPPVTVTASKSFPWIEVASIAVGIAGLYVATRKKKG